MPTGYQLMSIVATEHIKDLRAQATVARCARIARRGRRLRSPAVGACPPARPVAC